MLTVIYTILAFVIGFTLMVLVHEWGHYITGRMFGVKIDEFAIGMGPKLWSKKGKKSIFSIRAVPIGGFVKFTGDGESYGEQGEAEEDDPNILPNIKVWKKFIIYAAGAFMNIVLGFVLLVMLYLFVGTASNVPQIGDVVAGTPAEQAGLMTDDVIVQINGIDVEQNNFDVANSQISEQIGKDGDVIFTVNRNGELVNITLVPAFDEETQKLIAGFYFKLVYVPCSLGDSIVNAADMSLEMMTLIYEALGNMIFKGEGLDQMSGPVGIVSVISDATKDGIISIVSLFATLTLNLAVVNMLPFPALDGGKCVLLLIEAIRRKPLKMEIEGWLNLAGFVLLIILMIVLSVKDVASLFG